MLGIVLAFVSVHSLLAGRQRCGILWRCVTASDITSVPLAINGSAVVSQGRCVHHCTCLQFYFAQHTRRVHVACFSRLPTPSPHLLLLLFFIYFSLIYSVSFPFFFQFIVTSARAGAGSVFFWWAGLVAWLEVGQALASVLAVWVWGQQFQSPMSLSTQPPFATKALILHYQPNYCNKINYYSIVRWRKKLFLVLLQQENSYILNVRYKLMSPDSRSKRCQPQSWRTQSEESQMETAK